MQVIAKAYAKPNSKVTTESYSNGKRVGMGKRQQGQHSRQPNTTIGVDQPPRSTKKPAATAIAKVTMKASAEGTRRRRQKVIKTAIAKVTTEAATTGDISASRPCILQGLAHAPAQWSINWSDICILSIIYV